MGADNYRAKNIKDSDWTIASSEKYYGLKNWGKGHFKIDEEGFLKVHPLKDSNGIRIFDIIQEAKSKGYDLPLTIRIQDLLQTRVKELNETFRDAIEQEAYSGSYRGVFPIKVNQMREVLEEILEAGEAYNYGLECGSKPELMIALAHHKNLNSLIVCNGYKDDAFIRLALYGNRIGKSVFLVVEQLSEIQRIIRISKELAIQPKIGFRIKLSTVGEGKWARSSGEEAKFGLTSPEIVDAAESLKEAGLADCLELIHFHIGSQVPNIQTIKRATVEATRYYCELAAMGFPMKYLDVGGGLGVDYDGSMSNFESSMNYTLKEYARDVIYNIQAICSEAAVACPDIISESGRSVVASHSILVSEVCDRISKNSIAPKVRKENQAPIIENFISILENDYHGAPLERYHDAVQKKEEADNLFNLGYLNLKDKGLADAIFWKICQDVVLFYQEEKIQPEEMDVLKAMMADQYVCNFSVFQSLIDHWACDQLFPIAPIHRLNERPTVNTTLVDITCDSEGRIASFVDSEDERSLLRLHEIKKEESYFLGFFLMGAYQDIMGDLHNLFGRVNEVHVFLEDDEEDGFYIEDSIPGFSVNEVLKLTQYDGQILSRKLKKQIDRATKEDLIKPREGTRILDEYLQILKSQTYLNESN
ncbi:MAG: arginine decarboxylase [Puniceicoccaceae bacterium MED-G32]|nr:MAG: arginine decarboxylase [Puniceicoccaceae bacterium MED-G32]|tara:strand:- start:10958 stop:12898 length:1941 start_codon:yes stop_codon:yes gene_type:complete